jgi:hypothetical protein
MPAETQPPQYYRELFTENGTGGLCDYWRTATCRAFDLTGSRVFSWFGMNHPSSDVHNLTFPGDRGQLVQWGIDAAHANGADLSPFRTLLVVHNDGVDHGWAGNGFVLVHQDPRCANTASSATRWATGTACRTRLRPTPTSSTASFATSTFQFPITFNGTAGSAMVGLNARNLDALGAAPAGRSWTAPGPDFSSAVTLDPLSQPCCAATASLSCGSRRCDLSGASLGQHVSGRVPSQGRLGPGDP